MYVDWIAYILPYVDWIDVDSECWWISLELIELYVIVEMCWFGNEIDNVIVMWIVIEKWWVESEFDELLEIEWLVDNLIELCLLLRMMWKWNVMRWEMRCWDVDYERMNWAIEIVDLRLWWIGLNCWVMWIACVWW